MTIVWKNIEMPIFSQVYATITKKYGIGKLINILKLNFVIRKKNQYASNLTQGCSRLINFIVIDLSDFTACFTSNRLLKLQNEIYWSPN